MSIEFWIMAAVSLFMLGIAFSSAKSSSSATSEDDERRIAAILEKMSLEEKIDYVGGVDRFYIRSVPKLGIPRFKMADGPLGVRNYGPSTAMAGGIALAATWNVELAESVGAEIGRDARAKGVHFLLGPGVNIYRAPMNGRNFEYLGEDPFLVSTIAVGYIKGVQAQGVCATVKHFIGNNSEFDRRKSDAVIDERTLREIYLSAFEAAVKDAGVGAIMTSYNLANGFYMSQNGYLNNEVAKKEWGFNGIIMSDWTSTFDAIGAANGGLDLEMPSGDFMSRENLLPAIELGKVAKETIDDKVRRILRQAVRFGWPDRDQTDRTIPRYNRDGRRVALEAARQSMVLLKNESGLLPINREKVKSIAVIGPNAHPAVVVGGGSALVVPFHADSFLEGLSDALSDTVPVHYHPGIPSLDEISNATCFFTDSSTGSPGMQLERFNNMQLSGDPVQVCIERRIGAADRTPEFPEPFSSARWTGYYTAPKSGTYDVFIQIPGEKIGYRLYLDDTLLLDTWNYSKALVNTISVSLTDKPHKFVLELVRKGDGYTGGKLRLGIAQMESFVDPSARVLAQHADIVVIAAGFNPETESESGDRSFSLPFGQDVLIKEIAAANKNTIVAITSGGSVDMREWIDTVPAIIAAWYPGQEGGTALAEILLGDANPSGRLPITFERQWEDNPTYDSYYPKTGTDRVEYSEGVFVGYRGYERNNSKPLFPFGYGLSYTKYEYSDLSIQPGASRNTSGIDSGMDFEVSFDIKNSGASTGAEVAQLYVGSSSMEVPRPEKELKGYVRVSLNPGEKKRVAIRVGRRAFSYYDIKSKGWKVETGDRPILIGQSSEQIVLRGNVTL